MNYFKKTIIQFVMLLFVGILAILIVFFSNLAKEAKDGWYIGLTLGPIFTGLIGMILSMRVSKKPQKFKELEIAETEERTQYIRLKANAKVFSIMIYLESLGIFITGFLNYKEISVALTVLLLIKIILYFASITYYSKKY
jgi:uncharacterized membrane protein